MRNARKEKKTELEKPTGICTKLSLRIKRMKEEGKKGCVNFSLLHGTGGNEEHLIPMARNICFETTVINPRGKLLDNEIAVQFS